jgi:hypothetical protein
MLANLRTKMDEINWHFEKAAEANDTAHLIAKVTNNERIGPVPGFERVSSLARGFPLGLHPPPRIWDMWM